MTKRRSLAGNAALVINAASIILVYVAFFSTSWIESDRRIPGAQLERFGLWTHCFRSFPHPNDVDDQTIFVGCHWIFDPFTSRYNEVKSFLLRPFIVVTQVFYSITFFGTSLTAIGSLWFFLSSKPEDRRRIQLTFLLGTTLIVSGLSATISVLTFAIFANEAGWMPGHDNNYFSWAFGIAIASCFTLLGSGAFYLVETNVQVTKKKHITDSQIKFNVETEM